jgi:integrase
MFEAVAHAFQRGMMQSIVDRMQEQSAKVAPQWPSTPLIVIEGGLSAETHRQPSHPQEQVGLTITQAYEAWRDYTKGRARNLQTVQEWGLAVRRFVAMFGDIDMGEIRPQMVRDFREKLLELPGRTKKTIKTLPLDEQAVIAAREGLATLAPATVNKALTGIRSVTEHVIDKMSNVPLETNAAKMAKFVEVEDGEDKRLPFEEEDMKAIFRDLIIKDATGISEETLFWIVLLAPFTGCRLEEIGALRPLNVRSEQGIWFIAIERDRAQVRAGQDREEKSLKSSNSDRDIPVHSVLIRAGFLDCVERRRAE